MNNGDVFMTIGRGNGKSNLDIEKMLGHLEKGHNLVLTNTGTPKPVKSAKSYNMTVESFDNAMKLAREDERERVTDFIIKYYSAAVAMVLRDKWGFGQERLTRIIGQINGMYDSLLNGYVSIDDIRETILLETGLDLLGK